MRSVREVGCQSREHMAKPHQEEQGSMLVELSRRMQEMSIAKTCMPSNPRGQKPRKKCKLILNHMILNMLVFLFLTIWNYSNWKINFQNFLNISRQLHINISLIEALEIGRSLRLSCAHRNVVPSLKKKLPKLKDPRSIPCIIGNSFLKVLCDLSISVYIIPFSIFKKLEIGQVKPTTMHIQLVDRLITYSRGLIEDVLVCSS